VRFQQAEKKSRVKDTHSKVEHFTKAPIVEAILFVECYPLPDLSAESVAPLAAAFAPEYPRHRARYTTTSTVELAPRPGSALSSAETEIDGHLYFSADNQRAVQVRRKGYAFSWFAPYPGWDVFQMSARHGWEIFEERFNPQSVTRIGIRYLNRIELPFPIHKITDYLTTVPAGSPRIELDLSGFFMRLVLQDPSIPATGILTQATGERAPGETDPLPFTLDIEAYTTTVGIPDHLWDVVARLRAFKNQLFFDSITESTREMFR
jgi:uncharacterized protein (TIGR04255 family)